MGVLLDLPCVFVEVLTPRNRAYEAHHAVSLARVETGAYGGSCRDDYGITPGHRRNHPRNRLRHRSLMYSTDVNLRHLIGFELAT